MQSADGSIALTQHWRAVMAPHTAAVCRPHKQVKPAPWTDLDQYLTSFRTMFSLNSKQYLSSSLMSICSWSFLQSSWRENSILEFFIYVYNVPDWPGTVRPVCDSPWALPWSTAAPEEDTCPPGTSPSPRFSCSIQPPANYWPPPAYSSVDDIIMRLQAFPAEMSKQRLCFFRENKKLCSSYFQSMLTPRRQSFSAGENTKHASDWVKLQYVIW